MTQPRGFEDSTFPNHVCRSHKSIYGLKKAPRQWYNTFTTFLVSLGFSHSKSDPSLLIYNKDKARIFLLVYVDDILITGNNNDVINEILAQLNKAFSMKHLGTVNEFLGLSIQRYTKGFFLSQQKYASQILQQANLSACNPLSNPTCTKLPNDIQPDCNDVNMYRSLTGSLQYLTITRPDIAFSVNQLSQHMHEPQPQHFYMLKRLLRYIKGTLDFGIPITKTNLILTSFSDVDWAGDPISRKSTTGYCSFLGDIIISWKVQKQQTVARSSTESEYRALAALTSDVIWIRRLLQEFGIPQDSPTSIFCDNTSAIALANNPVFHARTKHIEIDHRFIRDHIHSNHICICPISTVDQVADILTKSLSTKRFQTLCNKLTVIKDSLVCRGVLEATS
ncbi:uncharacterized protein LOC110098020 [Dendrobium catenatum]|uniref:uncharacterized protein LOC110098020 n=1 Tax=Dendrobium catenatum TaxID=906689 RepID=UPI0009F5550A|nr:uncharacterized protein LOC110098020 [Dendrobium catenatum]